MNSGEIIKFYSPWNQMQTYGTRESRSKLIHLNSPKWTKPEFGDSP